MGKHKNSSVKPGDRVRVRFGGEIVDAMVTSVWLDRIHVTFSFEGSDEPVDGLYLESELLAA
ncbi:hypothetical protein ACFWUP_26155 [Nocardia sp. NPDC058658]|uniref:hypothetical protein n=1 Tax=Nocardia sp. NPDC058658 TaxID=3346580 RepID=UPI00365771CB